jgi:hypothetical protein
MHHHRSIDTSSCEIRTSLLFEFGTVPFDELHEQATDRRSAPLCLRTFKGDGAQQGPGRPREMNGCGQRFTLGRSERARLTSGVRFGVCGDLQGI